MKRINLISLGIAGALLFSVQAHAQQDGRFSVTVGGAHANPSNSTGQLAGGTLDAAIDGGNAPTLALGWHLNENVAFELWGALDRFTHDLSLNGGKAGTISHQPVALSAQYFFTGSQAFRPFLGLGWHHSNVNREHTTGALDGTRLGIETGEGPMGTVGMDFLVGERWFARADARYLRWRSDVAVDGANVGEAKVDPWLVGLSVGARF